jgi:hypothetical protein
MPLKSVTQKNDSVTPRLSNLPVGLFAGYSIYSDELNNLQRMVI